MLPAARMAKLLGRALHGGAEMPRAWIECAPKHGESPRRTASKPRSTDPKRVAGGRAGRLCGQAPHGGPRHREAAVRAEMRGLPHAQSRGIDRKSTRLN